MSGQEQSDVPISKFASTEQTHQPVAASNLPGTMGRSRTSSTTAITAQALNDNNETSLEETHILVVDWDGPDDPTHPRNWPGRKKWLATLAVSLFSLISPISSSMIAPAAGQVGQEFNIHNGTTQSMIVSAFVLAYGTLIAICVTYYAYELSSAVGPLVLSPLSEVYGRSRVLQIANLFFLAFNIGCAFAKNTSQMIAFRFLSGLGGSAPLSVGGGVLSDMFSADERGKAISIYSLAPLIGPVIGPIAGAWISQETTWRWVFRSSSIADAMVQVIGLWFLRETYPPLLLKWKAAALRKQMDTEKGSRRVLTVDEVNAPPRSWEETLVRALVRPFALFIQEPIIQLFGLYLSISYGIVYLSLTTIPSIFTDIYHEKIGFVGLHYIALGLGLFMTSQVHSRLLDKVYIHHKNMNGGVGKPEYRLPTSIVLSLGLPFGLLISGWAAEKAVHWIVVDIGLFLVGMGTIAAFQAMQTYIVDAFTLYAASALASVSCLRSTAGFAFPLFAPKMYQALGYGKGNTILAAASCVLGSPTLYLFWVYGERVRNMSKRTREAVKHSGKN
ncbi:hypothetical protein QCA50_005059 [Cerrena zonata]|uniref:Major facilitator superfamily (MFS) profile domain-containing protein n=1 Tax=Cerrena zonata TaxID=2478898 RepID=A0AAW0GR12_9APHY